MDIAIIVTLIITSAIALVGLPVLVWHRWQVAVERKRLLEYRRRLAADALYFAARDAKEAFAGLVTACGTLGLSLEEFAEAWAALGPEA